MVYLSRRENKLAEIRYIFASLSNPAAHQWHEQTMASHPRHVRGAGRPLFLPDNRHGLSGFG